MLGRKLQNPQYTTKLSVEQIAATAGANQSETRVHSALYFIGSRQRFCYNQLQVKSSSSKETLTSKKKLKQRLDIIPLWKAFGKAKKKKTQKGFCLFFAYMFLNGL